ncbi:MAG TPA: hypothetical protein VGF46_09170 [Gaiellales bacterium]|jgi:hypothetical protein
MRMHTLRRLQRRLDRALDDAGNQRVPAARRSELASLSVELQRELARLEQLPWPSGRVFARGDSRRLERRLLPLLRALRADPSPQPAPVLARAPAGRFAR